MASVQENGFKTIKQTYGSQHFGVTLDGVQTAKISGSNITAVDGVVRLYSSPFIGFGPQHPFDPTVPQEMYTYEGVLQFNAYARGNEAILYNHHVSSFDVNPFNTVLGENLGDFVVSVDEVWVYGAGQSGDSYNTIALALCTTRNFPSNQTNQTSPFTLFSWKNIIFTQSELAGMQVKADDGDIKIRVINISPVGTPSDPNDNIVYVKYKLTARKVFNI